MTASLFTIMPVVQCCSRGLRSPDPCICRRSAAYSLKASIIAGERIAESCRLGRTLCGKGRCFGHRRSPRRSVASVQSCTKMREADDLRGDGLIAIGVELRPSLRQLFDAGLLHGFCRAPDPVYAMDVHGRRNPVAVLASSLAEVRARRPCPNLPHWRVRPCFAILPVCVPLGDFRALDLHRGRRVAGDNVGAQFR